MASPIRIGIVGTGGIASYHVQSWHACAHTQVVAVMDVDRDKAKAFAAQWQPDAAIADTLDALLAMPDIDMIDVCTPETLHRVIVEPALASGRHVLTEKILAHTLADGAAMMAEAARHPGSHAGVQYNYRFFPQLRRLFDLQQSGERGELRLVHINAATHSFNHMLDALLVTGGGDPVRVSAAGGVQEAKAQCGVDASMAYQPGPVLSAQLEFENGFIAVINGTTRPIKPFSVLPFQITAMFEEGVLEISSLTWPKNLIGTCRWLPDGENQIDAADYPDPSALVMSFFPALNAVAQTIVGETPSLKPASFADGWRNMLACHAIVRSATEHRVVDFAALRAEVEGAGTAW